jgi:hypothetical protein
LNKLEDIVEGSSMVGNVKVTRRFVDSKGEGMFAHHTIVRDTSYFDEDLKATIAIVHGFGESSDIFIETAL